MTPQIDCLGKTSTVLRVSTHIYGVSKEIDGKMFIFRVMLYNVLQINQYISNITIKWHNESMSDNRDPTVVLHQGIYTLPVNVVSDTRCF